MSKPPRMPTRKTGLPAQFADISWERFGRLLVSGPAHDMDRNAAVRCVCDCNAALDVLVCDLKARTVTMCAKCATKHAAQIVRMRELYDETGRLYTENDDAIQAHLVLRDLRNDPTTGNAGGAMCPLCYADGASCHHHENGGSQLEGHALARGGESLLERIGRRFPHGLKKPKKSQ